MHEKLDLNTAAEYLGISRNLLDRLRKNGKELNAEKEGRRFVINKEDLDAWLNKLDRTTVLLEREDFSRAFKFALKINYHGHTRSDFGSARQRSIEQAVVNWTQGALAEIALSKFIIKRYNAEIVLDFNVREDNVIVGQDIVAVIKNNVENPPRKRISVKSGKSNAMFIIIPENEYLRPVRASDVYVFVRISLPEDAIFRFLRDHPELSDIKVIPPLEDIKAQIAGIAEKKYFKAVTKIPGVDFGNVRYVCETGLLKNSEEDFEEFVESL